MIKVPYLLQAPVKGVKLLDGRFLRAFNNNIAFLKRFDIDRMLTENSLKAIDNILI